VYFLVHFTDGNSFDEFHKIFLKVQKCINALFCTFYLVFALVDFLKSDFLKITFSKGSRSLCSALFLCFALFDQKVLTFSLKCWEMSGHCHGFKKCTLTKKYFI